MKVNCEIIEDLLPLYCDEVCSAASAELVEEHLETCANCQKKYQILTMDIPLKVVGGNEMEALKNIQEEIKKGEKRKFVSGFLVSTILFSTITIICFAAFNIIGSEVLADGTLKEPFFLIPIGFLFALFAILSLIGLGIQKFLSRKSS